MGRKKREFRYEDFSVGLKRTKTSKVSKAIMFCGLCITAVGLGIKDATERWFTCEELLNYENAKKETDESSEN